MSEYKQLALFANPVYHEYESGGKWANECLCTEHRYHRNHRLDEEEMNHE